MANGCVYVCVCPINQINNQVNCQQLATNTIGPVRDCSNENQ